MKRLFLALPVPLSIRHSLIHYKDSLSEHTYTWIKPENYHITLSFFHEQPESLIPAICSLSEKLATEIKPFTLTFDSLLLAPPEKSPTMLWAAYLSSTSFTDTVTLIESEIKKLLTFPDKREGQTPIPHITLARSKHFKQIPPQIILDPIHASEMKLYESSQVEQGRVYREIQSFPFPLQKTTG